MNDSSNNGQKEIIRFSAVKHSMCEKSGGTINMMYIQVKPTAGIPLKCFLTVPPLRLSLF